VPNPASGSARPVLALGEVLVDFIVADEATSLETAQTFAARAGGAPANAAVALARLGISSAFCGVAGRDPFGVRLQRELAAQDVDVSRLRLTAEAATTFAYAWKDARGDGHFWLLRGADTLLSDGDIAAADIPDLAALVVGSVALAAQPSRGAIERAVAAARQAAVPVVFDINLRPTLWADLGAARVVSEQIAARSTVVKLSLDDARGLYDPAIAPEGAVQRVLALDPLSVVLTDGDRGCWFASHAHPEVVHVPAFAIAAIEPTGAGDAFTAALIARLLASGWSPPTAADARFAAAAGALATTKPGAWEGLPSRDQLSAFLASAP
jgi:sugar/nucleoside kinase (ribokinase family)